MLQQQTSSFKKKILATTVVAVVAIFASGLLSHAYALTISPARIEISGNPGAQVGGQFTLINEQANTQTFYATYENFSAQGETGAPAFTSDKTDLDTWIAVTPTQITIPAGKAETIPYTITIPKTAEPGGYFAAIFWGSNPPSTSTTQVSIGAKVGLLVLLTVNGNVKESAGINQFDTNGHSFFYTALPVTLRYKFHNSGGDRVQPIGNITIRDTVFLPAVTLDANPAQGNILPNSTRQFTVQWLTQQNTEPVQGFFANVNYEWQNFAVGLYSAHLNLSYGTKGLHTSNTIWFFVLPWQLLICILVVIIILWWGIKALLKRYNSYIITQAQARMKQYDTEQS